MSSVKIQVIEGTDYTFPNKVLVDNKLAYGFGHSRAVEESNLRKLVELLQLDNVEVTGKERV